MSADVDGQEEMFGGGNVARLEDGDILASLSAWARVFGIERETLRRRLVDAGVRSKGERGGHPVYGGRDVVSAWMSGPEARIDPDSLSPFQRRAWYQGEHEKLKLQVERGELVSALEVEQTMGRLAKAFVLGLDTLMDVIERDAGLTALQAKRMEQHVDRVRENIYRELAGGEDGERPEASGAPEPEPKPRPRPAAGGTALEEAVAFLREALAGGPRPSAELVAAAREAAISEGTLRRAKAQLGKSVVAKREGRGWVWSLAESPAEKPRKSGKRRKR